jgi:hypothetical protein
MKAISRSLILSGLLLVVPFAGPLRGEPHDLQSRAGELAKNNKWNAVLGALDSASSEEVGTYWFFYFRALAYYGKLMPVPASHDRALFERFLEREARSNVDVAKSAAGLRKTVVDARERADARLAELSLRSSSQGTASGAAAAGSAPPSQ